MTLRRLAIVVGDRSIATPPIGYGGLTRLAYAVAIECAALGIAVTLFAPLFRDDPALYRGLEGVGTFPPNTEALSTFDAIYCVDTTGLAACAAALTVLSDKVFVLEENAPWLWSDTRPNLYHVLFRADRIPRLPQGRTWLVDQVLSRDEVGPPALPEGYVLWLGRIHRDKGIEGIISFAEAVPDVRVRLAGPLAVRRRWPPNVALIGEVAGAEKRALLTGADALLYTVSSMWTGAGEGVLTEALACGLPILAQAAGPGTPASRCVVDGVNGFVHPDAAALARLLPLAQRMDRVGNHRLAWTRLNPTHVAADRIRRIDAALLALHTSRRDAWRRL